MSFFPDLFGGAGNAAQSQEQAALLGMGAAQQGAGQATGAINTATANAVAPYNTLWNNYAIPGVGAYANALGLGGPSGNASALATLEATPGYQFALQQGNNAINAAAAANGTLNSGNQLTALSNYNQGLAQQTYGNYVSQLAPYLNLALGTAGGIGNIYQNQGAELAGVAETQAKAIQDAIAGFGKAQASGSLANQSLDQNLLAGGLGFLANSGLGGSSGRSGGFTDSLLGKAISGLGTFAGGLGLTFSDERLKDDIEPVGELFDGQTVYRYKYLDDPLTTHIGVLAQEAAEANPDAVVDIGGFLAVDYNSATNYAAALGGLLEAA